MHSLAKFEVGLTHCKEAGKQYRIVVNSIQYAILSLFNDKDEMTYSDIERALDVNGGHLIKDAMLKLCNPKISVLKKALKKPVFGADEKISLNKAYTNKSIKLDCRPARPKPDIQKVVTSVNQDVLRMRLDVCQAQIVK